MQRHVLAFVFLIGCNATSPVVMHPTPLRAQTPPPRCPEVPARAAPSAEPSLAGCSVPFVAFAATAASDASCTPFDAASLERLEAELRRKRGTNRSYKLVVDYGCDQLDGDELPEIVLETGSGHAQSLVLTQLVRDGDVYRVRRLQWSHLENGGTSIESATLPVKIIDRLIPGARIALLARTHLVAVQHRGEQGIQRRLRFSSHDYHLALGLFDAKGVSLHRGFTGYERDSGDEHAMHLATAKLVTAFDRAPFQERPVEDGDRAFFAEQFQRMQAESKPAWWVQERLLGMAAVLGTRALLPSLLHIAHEPLTKHASAERIHQAAMTAMAAIVGVEAANPTLAALTQRVQDLCKP